MARPSFILASASPRRLQLLKQIGYEPDQVIASDLDETLLPKELPLEYVRRMSREKCATVSARFPQAVVLAADTVVCCGRRILPKADDEKTARDCLRILQGRRHRVYTAVSVAYGNARRDIVAMTHVQFARLTDHDISHYVESGEWEGKAGGYAIQGKAEAFIPSINGSFSNVVGLPLAQTKRLLQAVLKE
ncbi:MAG: Maf family protein [Rickettsiales bacterium]|nr:Maf family protein [Rickettsiales bacterium]